MKFALIIVTNTVKNKSFNLIQVLFYFFTDFKKLKNLNELILIDSQHKRTDIFSPNRLVAILKDSLPPKVQTTQTFPTKVRSIQDKMPRLSTKRPLPHRQSTTCTVMSTNQKWACTNRRRRPYQFCRLGSPSLAWS